MERTVFLLYALKDETEILTLTNDISKNITRLSIGNKQEIDANTKTNILECDIFICCLSTSSSKSLINIVKFARCIARKQINTLFLETADKCLEEEEDKSFFNDKTHKIDSIRDHIEKVNLFQ